MWFSALTLRLQWSNSMGKSTGERMDFYWDIRISDSDTRVTCTEIIVEMFGMEEFSKVTVKGKNKGPKSGIAEHILYG